MPELQQTELRHPASAADRDQTWEIMRRAFNAKRERREQWDKGSPDHLLWGLYDGGELLASAKVMGWGQFFGGRSVPLAAVAGVGVAPQQRGRGHASRLFEQLLPAARAEGFALSGLMPATTSLYRKAGYEVAARWRQSKLPTRALHGLPRATHVPVRVGTVEDIPEIVAVERRLGAEVHGWLDVSDEWWAWFAETGFDDGFQYLADGGSTWYRYGEDPSWGYSIEVLGMVAESVDVLCALWHAVGSSSTMGRTLTITSPMEDALNLLLPEQELSTSMQIEYMLRILDLPAAVEARGYPTGVRASAVVTARDPIIGDNDGTWTISVEDGKGRAERGGSGGVELPINALASLYSGWATPALLRSTGLLAGGTADDGAALASMFAGPRPVVQQFF